MNEKGKKQLMWIVGIVIAVIILYPYLNMQKFEITNNDYVYEGVTSYGVNTLGSPYTSDNVTISFYLNTIKYIYAPGDVYYMLDTEQVPYNETPIVEGGHIIRMYKLNLTNNNTEVDLYRWLLAMKSETNIIQLNATSQQICIGLGGRYYNLTCHCPNNSTWVDNSTSSAKYCGPITITNTITITPTFFEKYGTALIVGGILLVVIIYLMFFDRKKK